MILNISDSDPFEILFEVKKRSQFFLIELSIMEQNANQMFDELQIVPIDQIVVIFLPRSFVLLLESASATQNKQQTPLFNEHHHFNQKIQLLPNQMELPFTINPVQPITPVISIEFTLIRSSIVKSPFVSLCFFSFWFWAFPINSEITSDGTIGNSNKTRKTRRTFGSLSVIDRILFAKNSNSSSEVWRTLSGRIPFAF